MKNNLFSGVDENNNYEDDSDFDGALKELMVSCEKNNIECNLDTDFLDDKYAVVWMPCGREKRPIYFSDSAGIKRFLSISYMDYTFLGEYQAICSYKDNFIEASFNSLIPRSTFYLIRRLMGIKSREEEELKDANILLSNEIGDSSCEIEISICSDEFIILVNPRLRRRKTITLKIKNIILNNHDLAIDLLEKLSNSLFFQIDLLTDLPLSLERRRIISRRFPARKYSDTVENLKFPQFEYDNAPLKLYWYARSASRMPLLQFLAFYQALEYYFPIHSEAEARRKIRTLLKNPSFRFDRDSDIAKILKVIRTRGPYGFGDERSQLRSVIQECINPNELREFLSEDEEKIKFFSSKTKGLTECKIQIKNPNADLRDDVSDRIYDIRCKIVHTKSESKEGKVEILLPFTKEVELLVNDIELIQFISRQVIIAGSSALKS